MFLNDEYRRLLRIYQQTLDHVQELFIHKREALFQGEALIVRYPETHMLTDPFTGEQRLRYKVLTVPKNSVSQLMYELGASKDESKKFMTCLTTYLTPYRAFKKDEVQLPVIFMYKSAFMFAEVPVLVDWIPQDKAVTITSATSFQHAI